MIKIETARLRIYSDASVIDGVLVFPKKEQKDIDVTQLEPRQSQTSGFAIYLKDDNTQQVGQFGFSNERYKTNSHMALMNLTAENTICRKQWKPLFLGFSKTLLQQLFM